MKLYLVPSGRSAHSLGPFPVPLVAGRGENVDLQVQDRWASRRHCEFAVQDGKVVLRDLDSTHGTYVNGERVSEAALSPGDQINVGLTSFTVFWNSMLHDETEHPFDSSVYREDADVV